MLAFGDTNGWPDWTILLGTKGWLQTPNDPKSGKWNLSGCDGYASVTNIVTDVKEWLQILLFGKADYAYGTNKKLYEKQNPKDKTRHLTHIPNP